MRWLQLALLSVAELLLLGLWFSASAVVPQLAQEWALADAQKAWMTMSVQLGFVLGALGSAMLNLPDRVPNRFLIATSGLLAAATNAAIAVFDVGVGGTLVLRGWTGVCLASVYPPGMKLVASWIVRERGFAIGTLVAAITVGSAGPHLLNALPLLGAGGLPPWRSVLLVASALAVAGAGIVLLFVRQGPDLPASAPFQWRFAAHVMSERPLRLATFGYLGHMWELYAMWTWVPVMLLRSYESAGWSLASARLAGFATVAAGGVGCVVAGVLADRLGRTAITVASLALSGSCCIAAGFLLGAPAALTTLCILWGVAVVADSAQFSAALTELADRRYIGTVLTVQTALGFLLTLVTIQIVPLVVARAGWSVALGSLALGPVFGIVSMLRLRALPAAVRMASGKR